MNVLLRTGLLTLRRGVLTSPRRALATRPPFVPLSHYNAYGPSVGTQDHQRDQAEYYEEEQDDDEESDEESDDGVYEELNEEEAFEEEESDEEGANTGEKKPPTSPSFYSGRAAYYDQLTQIESAVAHTRSALKMLQLLPLPPFARDSLPVRPAIWKSAEEMGEDLNVPMTSSRYRTLTRLLGQMNDYLRIATAAGCDDLASSARNLLNIFESAKKEANLTRGRRKTSHVDHLGRSYTFGKRKTSTARVWMVPVQPPKSDPKRDESVESMFGVEELRPSHPSPTASLPTTTILINNIPIGEFFALPGDRERAIRPLKVAGVIGAYNIFSLVRGGGTTGQSDALAHGISKGLLVHDTALGNLLRRTKLLRRDPRMVERKKTGRPKARKGYTWVKR